MKTFLLAALAGIAAANDLLENKISYPVDLDLLAGTNVLGILKTVSTGWSKNGSGSDAVIDRKLWMDYEKNPSRNFVSAAGS